MLDPRWRAVIPHCLPPRSTRGQVADRLPSTHRSTLHTEGDVLAVRVTGDYIRGKIVAVP